MAQKTLNLKIADYGVSITTETPALLSCFGDNLTGFISDKHPDFTIDILDKQEDFTGIGLDNMAGIDASEQGGKIYFYTKTKPKIMLGFFSAEEKKAFFIHRHEDLSRQYQASFLRVCFQLFLFLRGECLVHACGVEKDGEGYLFPAPSGYGKTTIAGFSAAYNVLSDEFICLRQKNNNYFIYPTPWQGKQHDGVVLKKVFFPRKAGHLGIKRLTPCQSAEEILSNIIYAFYNQNIFQHLLSFLAEMTKKVPCYLMHFSLSPAFWEKIGYDS